MSKFRKSDLTVLPSGPILAINGKPDRLTGAGVSKRGTLAYNPQDGSLYVNVGSLATPHWLKLEGATIALPERRPDAQYSPSPLDVVSRLLEMAGVTKNDVVYDVACGDGRVLVGAAKGYGCRAVGVDIDPTRVVEAKANIIKAKMQDLAQASLGDCFQIDLRPATVVVCYLMPWMMTKMIPQFQAMRPGSRIVSHEFKIKGVAAPEATHYLKSVVDGWRHPLFLWHTPLMLVA